MVRKHEKPLQQVVHGITEKQNSIISQIHQPRQAYEFKKKHADGPLLPSLNVS